MVTHPQHKSRARLASGKRRLSASNKPQDLISMWNCELREIILKLTAEVARVGDVLQGRTVAKQQDTAIGQEAMEEEMLHCHTRLDCGCAEHHVIAEQMDQDWSEEALDSYGYQWFDAKGLPTAPPRWNIVKCEEEDLQCFEGNKGMCYGEDQDLQCSEDSKDKCNEKDQEQMDCAVQPTGGAELKAVCREQVRAHQQHIKVEAADMKQVVFASHQHAAQGRGYSDGDAVDIWSCSRQIWFQDGQVIKTATETVTQGDWSYPPGSLLITYNNNGMKKWVKPSLRDALLRPGCKEEQLQIGY